MLLISVLFLATAVEARPGGGSRQLGKKKKFLNAIATVGSARLPTVTANRLPGADRHRPPSSIGATATVLNLPHCYGMLDKDERKQYSVHAWLLKAAAAAVQSAEPL